MADDNRKTHAVHFDRVHSAQLQSEAVQAVWQAAYGDEYPAEVNPSAFYARSTLERLFDGLAIQPGQTFVDLGCGTGGAALWVAERYRANVIGIDLSPGGVALGNERAQTRGLAGTARFIVGDMTATGLETASCDGAFSLDVLCFVPDKPAALAETARILRPGSRLGITTWEQDGYSERLQAAQMTDHRPALEAAGFEVERYEEPANWQIEQRTVLEGILAAEAKLRDSLTPADANRFVGLAHGMLADMPKRRYVSILARRR